jgi:hypothetical protein
LCSVITPVYNKLPKIWSCRAARVPYPKGVAAR